jgi:hypothetical protein
MADVILIFSNNVVSIGDVKLEKRGVRASDDDTEWKQ